MSSPVSAQAAAEKPDDSNIVEVIVTSAKRQTLLQKTPMAISAFSTAALERSSIKDVTDLAAYTPGLSASTNVGGTYAIRGISSDLLSISADSSVSTYVDGVYMTRQTSNQIPFVDVQQIEVLRGPQGTIYGRNATGGVINFITKAPSDTFNGSVSFGLGNLNQIQGGLMLTGPLIKDRVLFRVSASSTRRDGFITNVGLPGSRKYDDENNQSYRGKLLFNVADNLKITLAADLYKQHQDFPIDQVLALGSAGAGAILPTGKFEAAFNLADTYDDRNLLGTSATIKWSPNDSMEVVSITAYRDTLTEFLTDDDATTLSVSNVHLRETDKAYSQELYARSTGNSKLNYLVGANFLSQISGQNLSDSSPAETDYLPAESTTKAWAVYGQLDYAVTERLKITAGVRYSSEDRTMVNAIYYDVGAGVQNAFGPLARKASFNAVTPNFTVDYKLSDKTLIYALAARGFKSGGFASLGTSPLAFKPEFVWNFETGLKTSMYDGRARFNIAAFHADYTNLQRRTGATLATITLENAAAAKIDGVEVETVLAPTRHWTINAAYSYLDAKYEDYQTALPGTSSLTQLAGLTMERSPKHKFSVINSVVVPLSAGDLELNGGLTYQSLVTSRTGKLTPGTVPGTVYDPALYEQKGYSLADASIKFSPNNSHWSIQVYGKNLGNKEYFVHKEGQINAAAAASGYSGLPRTYGVRLKADF
jgi:iron complex outermembrane receptor protein